jgi:CMP-N,N'-diacetyllegionaminic acid synthase
MISGKKVLAVIPAREGSKGLPGKNIRPFRGKPLLLWSVEHGISSRFVDRVIVSTDSEEYAVIVQNSGGCVPCLRPKSLATDTATSVEVVLHAVAFLEAHGDAYDILALLEPTSPLRKPEDIDGALELLLSKPDAESVVSISPTEAHHPAYLMKKMSTGFLQPYLPNFKVIRRQDIQPLHFLDGTVYISWINALRTRKSFYHERTLGYEVPKYQSFEIDDMDDFIICEALHRAKFPEKE